MDVDVELEHVQAELYSAQKEVETLEAELRRKVDTVALLQRRELTLLQQRQQNAVPLPGWGGGLLVTAVWENEGSSGGEFDIAGDVGEGGEVCEDGLDGVQSSTQEYGHEAQVQFSQPLSDISEKRVKVSRGEANAIERDRVVSRKEAAEAMLCRVLNVGQVDLSSDDLQEFENCIANLGKRMGHLRQLVKKSKQVANPDDTFLSSSMVEDLQQKVRAKKAAAEEDLDSQGDLSGDVVGKVLMEQGQRGDEGENEEEGSKSKGYYKAFTDLVHLSKDMKTRAAPLHARLSEWCELNRCSKVAALGYLLHSLFYNEDKTLASVGLKLFTQGREAILVAEVPYLVALWLVERLRLGRGRYTDCRLLLLRFCICIVLFWVQNSKHFFLRYVRLPAYQHVSDLRIQLCPKIVPYPKGSSGNEQRGVCTNLGEAITLVLREGLAAWEPKGWMSSCSDTSQCQNLVARILISADGRGDERQHAQRSQASLDTSHAFSVVWSLPSIHLALPPQDLDHAVEMEENLPQSASDCLYQPESILPALRESIELEKGHVVWTGAAPSVSPASSWRNWQGVRRQGLSWEEECGIRVWSIPYQLEEDFMTRVPLKRRLDEDCGVGSEPTKLARRGKELLVEDMKVANLGVLMDGGGGITQDQHEAEEHSGQLAEGGEDDHDEALTEQEVKEQELRRRLQEIQKPIGFQRLGQEVYEDPAPQSHRAQNPWLLAHQRENIDTVREVMDSVIDPGVEQLRSHCLVAEDVIDLRTGYMTVVGTGVMESRLVDGVEVQWERKEILEVEKEHSRTAHLGEVPVRRTVRLRGDKAGRRNDQARVEDLSKPLLILCPPCGHLQSISADISLGGLDTKMIRLINQRTGAYCYCCSATAAEGNDPDRVRQGFDADMSMERVLDLARELLDEAGVPVDQRADFELVAQRGDEKTRQVLCTQIIWIGNNTA